VNHQLLSDCGVNVGLLASSASTRLYRRWQRERAGLPTLKEYKAACALKRAQKKANRESQRLRRIEERSQRPKPLTFAQRYQNDANFRAKEIERTHKRKAIANWPVDGTLTGEAIQSLFAKAKRCPLCRARLNSSNKSLDHIVPKSKGGWHSIFNVRVICKPCNTQKGHKIPNQLTLGSGIRSGDGPKKVVGSSRGCYNEGDG
jgi:5-methylcytosine-specific restriction endonuclease McrA